MKLSVIFVILIIYNIAIIKTNTLLHEDFYEKSSNFNGNLFELSSSCGSTFGQSAILKSGSTNSERNLIFKSVDCSSYQDCNVSIWLRSGKWDDKTCWGYGSLSESIISKRTENPSLIIDYQIGSSGSPVIIKTIKVTQTSHIWKRYSFKLPSSNNVILRIRQPKHFGYIYDVWAIDDVRIEGNPKIQSIEDYCPTYDIYARIQYPAPPKPSITMNSTHVMLTIDNIFTWKYGSFIVTFQSYSGEKYILDKRCLDTGVNYPIENYKFMNTTVNNYQQFTNTRWKKEIIGDCQYKLYLEMSIEEIKNCRQGGSTSSPIQTISTNEEERIIGSFYMSYIAPPSIQNPNEFLYSQSNYHFNIFFQKEVAIIGTKVSCQGSNNIKDKYLNLHILCDVEDENETKHLAAPNFVSGTVPFGLFSYKVYKTKSVAYKGLASEFLFGSFQQSDKFEGSSKFESELCLDKKCSTKNKNLVPMTFPFNSFSQGLSGNVNYIGRLWLSNENRWDENKGKERIVLNDQMVYIAVVSDAPKGFQMVCNSIKVFYFMNGKKSLQPSIEWIYGKGTTQNYITALSSNEFVSPVKDSPVLAWKYDVKNHARIPGGTYTIESHCVISPQASVRKELKRSNLGEQVLDVDNTFGAIMQNSKTSDSNIQKLSILSLVLSFVLYLFI